MAGRPSVRWNESKQRWMAWVRFPDGSRRKVERTDRADAERDLQELLGRRSQGEATAPGSRLRLATFDEVLDAWVAAGCPKAAVSRDSRRARAKSANTIATIGYLFDGHVRPAIGGLRVNRTSTERVEQVFRGPSGRTRRRTCCCRRRGRRVPQVVDDRRGRHVVAGGDPA